jgi:SNF2 family DNA or RNA helicase
MHGESPKLVVVEDTAEAALEGGKAPEPASPLALRPFQAETVKFCIRRNRSIIGHDPGLGKTRCALETLATWIFPPTDVLAERLAARQKWYEKNSFNVKAKPSILVACTKSGMHVWVAEVKKWIRDLVDDDFLDPPILIEGSKLKRLKLWSKATFAVCTLETFKFDATADGPISRRQWDIMIVDEAHKIRNRKTQNYKAIKHVASQILKLILISATPMSRGAQDIWTLMHLCDPQIYPSYWKWVNTFCIVVDDEYGFQIVGNKNVDMLGQALSKHMIRYSREDVAPELPKKHRIPLEIELSPEFRRLYDLLESEMLTDLTALIETGDTNQLAWVDGSADTSGEDSQDEDSQDENFLLGGRLTNESEAKSDSSSAGSKSHILMAPNQLVSLTRARQLMVSPRLLGPEYSYGPALEVVGGWLDDQAEPQDRHVIIYTSFAKALPILDEYLHGMFPDMPIYHIKGGMKSDELKGIEEAFRADPTSLVVGTIRSAQSYSLETARAVFFIGPDWDHSANIQAEDRALRLTTVNRGSLPFYYVSALNTIDDVVMDAVKDKYSNTAEVLNSLHKHLKMKLGQ